MRPRPAALILCTLLAGCGSLTLDDQFMEGSVRGLIAGPAGTGVPGVALAVHRTSGCDTCLGSVVSNGAASPTGEYALVISVPRDEAASATFALAVLPAASTGLAGDTVPFVPVLDPNGSTPLILNVQLATRP
jgi:uncharacterized protein YceK